MPTPVFHPRRPEDSPWGECCLCTFTIISSVFPWPTASGLMIARVQAFSDEAVISQGGAVRRWAHPSWRLSGGRLQGPHSPCAQLPGAPRLASGCGPADLDSSGSTGLAPDLNLSLAAGDRDMPETQTWEGAREGGGGHGRGRGKGGVGGDQRLPRNRNPETAERGGLQGEEGGAGAEATQAWLLLFLPVTLMIPAWPLTADYCVLLSLCGLLCQCFFLTSLARGQGGLSGALSPHDPSASAPMTKLQLSSLLCLRSTPPGRSPNWPAWCSQLRPQA